MRLLAAVLFVGATLAVASLSTAQPPEGGKGGQPPEGGKGGKGDKGGFGGPGGKGGKGGFGGGFGGPPLGQVMPVFVQDQLKLTDAQKKDLEAIQKDVDAKIEKLLTDEQKKTFQSMKERRGPGGRGGPGGNPPGKGPNPPNKD